jgi:CDGSH-type Zn-finger protein
MYLVNGIYIKPLIMEKKITHISRKEKGQIVVHGDVNLTDFEGNKIPHGEKFTLCGCAKSKKLPFCDGSHKIN